MRRRTGFTLVEVALFGGLGLMVLLGAWGILYVSLRRGSGTETKVQGVQAALLTSRRLADDLEALVEDEAHPLVLEEGPQGVALRFHRLESTSAEGEWQALPLVGVTYIWESSRLRLLRRQGDGPFVPLAGTFERPEFVLDEAAGVVGYRLTATTPEWLGRPDGERSPAGRTILPGAVARHSLLARRGFVHVNRVPYGE